MYNLASKSLMCYLADSAVVFFPFYFLLSAKCHPSNEMPYAWSWVSSWIHRFWEQKGPLSDWTWLLHSPGHPAPHHCVSTEPNPWSVASSECSVLSSRTSQDRREGCLEKDLKELCGGLGNAISSAGWGLSPLSPLNSRAAWSAGDLCLELCWFVSCFVKIPESGEAEEKKDQFFQCVFVWSHKCEFSDQIISLSFIYNVRCFPACFAECTFWSSPSLNWDLHQPFKCISSLFTAQWSGCSLHSWVKNVEKSNFDASNLNENLSAFSLYHRSILSFL